MQEGIGGIATITGKVYVLDYNSGFTQLNSEYYAPAEDVYIVYGDEEVYADKMETHHDGTFRFDFLRKGTYTIFVYSQDSTENEPSGEFAVMREIEITKRNQEINLGDIVIVK